jgi:oxygen-independent coproporphyrinogen-3 oxidase
VDRLLLDLDGELTRAPAAEPLASVFFGGGTPSLFSGASISRLLDGIRRRASVPGDAEITLEANPGAADAGRFAAYREAGVNRLSIGIQSLSAESLRRLGRIHGPEEAREAYRCAREAGFENINLDLMHGLPGQDLEGARIDLEQALEMEPEHLSYYQLTLEPNTAFHAQPPPLPDDDEVADMHLQGVELLASAGFFQYEVSAYARPGHRCRHNLNYWTFGDYLGIGAGAHGKRTEAAGSVERRAKLRHPSAYLASANREQLVSSRVRLRREDLALEFAMNALRLTDGFTPGLFERRTGLPFARLEVRIAAAEADALLERSDGSIRPTDLGRRFLNDLIGRFSTASDLEVADNILG